jgi:hypothetical protein
VAAISSDARRRKGARKHALCDHDNRTLSVRLPTRERKLIRQAMMASRAVAGNDRDHDSPRIPDSPAGFLESRRGL